MVSTAVGGVPEVVIDGENGLLVPPGDPSELAAAMRRMLEEPGLRDRLAAAAKPSVEAISSEAIYGKLEALLRRRRDDRAAPGSLRRAGSLPASAPGWLAQKWDAVEEQLDYRVIGAATGDSAPNDDRFQLARPGGRAGSTASSSTCGCRCACGARSGASGRRRSSHRIPSSGRPRSPVAHSPGGATPVIVEVHGDWRTFSRLYGSPARRLISPLADAVAAYAVRRADATRAVSTLHRGTRREDPGRSAERSLHGVQ